MRRAVVALALLAAVAALAACGGDDGGEGGEAAAVEAAIVGSMQGDDPADCARYNTQAGLERTSGLGGDAALRFCEELVDDERIEDPRSVEIAAVEVDGGEARAEVAIAGSTLDGQTVEIAVLERDGGWKVDRLVEFVVFDRERLLDGIRREVELFSEQAPDAALASCMLSEIEELGDEELRGLALRSEEASIHAIAESCARQSESSQTL